jgi:hypothetical protein
VLDRKPERAVNRVRAVRARWDLLNRGGTHPIAPLS